MVTYGPTGWIDDRQKQFRAGDKFTRYIFAVMDIRMLTMLDVQKSRICNIFEYMQRKFEMFEQYNCTRDYKCREHTSTVRTINNRNSN